MDSWKLGSLEAWKLGSYKAQRKEFTAEIAESAEKRLKLKENWPQTHTDSHGQRSWEDERVRRWEGERVKGQSSKQ
jgi:hypothetical protein